jgi:hypothetical protein
MSRAAFVDPASGVVGGDSFTIAWAESDGKKVTLQGCLERRPPFSPRATALEFAQVLVNQGFTRCIGDAYAGLWPREPFQESGVTYVVSPRTKSELYAAFLILSNSGLVRIPLHRRLISQLQRLERRVLRSGREQIDHSVGSHDDLSNACCGAMVLAHEASTDTAARGPTLGIHVLHIGRFGESTRIPESQWPSFGPPSAQDMDPASDKGFGPPRSGPRAPSFARGR